MDAFSIAPSGVRMPSNPRPPPGLYIPLQEIQAPLRLPNGCANPDTVHGTWRDSAISALPCSGKRRDLHMTATHNTNARTHTNAHIYTQTHTHIHVQISPSPPSTLTECDLAVHYSEYVRGCNWHTNIGRFYGTALVTATPPPMPVFATPPSSTEPLSTQPQSPAAPTVDAASASNVLVMSSASASAANAAPTAEALSQRYLIGESGSSLTESLQLLHGSMGQALNMSAIVAICEQVIRLFLIYCTHTHTHTHTHTNTHTHTHTHTHPTHHPP